MILTNIVYFATVLFCTVGALMIFFRGSCAYCHLLELAQKIGIKSSTPGFWKYVPPSVRELPTKSPIFLEIKDFTFDDAIEFISSKNRYFGMLLSCPFCLSWHLTFWSSLFVIFGGYVVYGLIFPLWLAVLTFVSVPYLSNYLIKKV